VKIQKFQGGCENKKVSKGVKLFEFKITVMKKIIQSLATKLKISLVMIHETFPISCLSFAFIHHYKSFENFPENVSVIHC
jgi:hypothetical protein